MIRAVLFDLFGTLVKETPKPVFREMLVNMAAELGVETKAFLDAWSASAIERQTGALGDMERNVRVICERTGVRPSDDAVAAALELRAALYARQFVAKDGAEETLDAVRARGMRTGLISMCAPDTPALWRGSRLAERVDVAVFSCETGFRKPDPEVYLAATDALGVGPEECVYVGDGAYRELTGAQRLGMRAVLVKDPAEHDALRPEAEEWTGASIGRLSELPALLDGEA